MDLTFKWKIIIHIYSYKYALIAVISYQFYAQNDFPKALKLVGTYLVLSLLDCLVYWGCCEVKYVPMIFVVISILV